MLPELLYTTCLVGAVGLYVLLRPGRRAARVVGSLLALGAAVWLLVQIPRGVSDAGYRPEFFYLAFSLIAICSAVRMITHGKPVYSALYFILVVLSSAGLFLLMQAEFMAFALIIVYAGAILITYLFVLMLAQQKASPEDAGGASDYDVVAREPAAGAIVGLVMMALLGGMLRDVEGLPTAPTEMQARQAIWAKLEQLPQRFRTQIHRVEPAFNWPPVLNERGGLVSIDAEGDAYVTGTIGTDAQNVRVRLPESAMPENVQEVGLDLVAKFPVSLELAGVILLLAMFGAVVLARKQIELGEDEIREAAGLPRFAFHEDTIEPHPGGPGEGETAP